MIKLTKEMFAAANGRPIAQGEVYIWDQEFAPKNIMEQIGGNTKELNLELGQMIVGHSETGHHHVLVPVDNNLTIDKAASALISGLNELFLDLTVANDCELKHQRENHTHDGYLLPKGKYVIKIREEQTPEGWRRSAD